MVGADPLGGVEAFAGVRRRHADVDDDGVRRVGSRPRASSSLGVADLGGDLDAGVCEHPGQPLAEQHRVVGDHDPHGSSARDAGPWPVRAVHPEVAVEGGDPVGQAAQARAVGVGAADAVVADLDYQAGSSAAGARW